MRQLSIDGAELELEQLAPRAAAAPAEQEGLFAGGAFAQLRGQLPALLVVDPDAPVPTPRDVACPRCGAGVGSPCKRPSGHTVFAGGIHAPRERALRELVRGSLPPAPAPVADPPQNPPASSSAPESAPETPPRSTSAADPEHRARMRAGLERWQLEQDARAIERVERFRAWTRAGSRGAPPEIPTDGDFHTARAAGSWAAPTSGRAS